MKSTIIKLSVVVLTLLLSGCGGTPSTPADTNQSAIDNGGSDTPTTPDTNEPNVDNGGSDTPTTPDTNQPNVDNGGSDTPTTPDTNEPNGGSDTPTNEPPAEVVVDNTPPVITVSGANPFTITQGDTYADAGATATDDIDGEIEIVPSGEVIMSVAGNYTITYTAVDKAGNEVNATRTVIVKPADVIWNVSNITEFRNALESATLNGTGDKIILEAGTYNVMSDNLGTLNFDDNEEFNLTIKAKEGLTYRDVILDGNNTQQVFSFDNKYNSTLTIKNISVINGKTSLNGGGVYSSGSVVIEDCNISENNTSISGGGIYATKGVTLTNSSVSYNTSADSGGGFYAGDTTIVINSTISYNTNYVINGYYSFTESYGGGFYSGGSTTTVMDSTISYNTNYNTSSDEKGYGGGFYAKSTTTVTNSTISYNTNTSGKSRGGGFYIGNIVTVTNSTISYNKNIASYSFYPESYGGGFYAGETIVISSTLNMNSAIGSSAYGGGVYSGNTIITESIFSDNNATRYEGGLYGGGTGGGLYVSELDISNSSFTNNTASSYGTLASDSIIMVNSFIANSNNNAVGTSTGYYSGKSYFSNNVFINNTENALSARGVFVNNIFVDNENDISLTGETYVYNNYIDYAKIIDNGESIYKKSNLQPASVGDIYLSDDNVTLLSNSPAIDKGLNIGSTTYKDMVNDETIYARLNELLTTDKVGNVRVFGDLVDIGAVEYGSSK